MIRGCDLSHFQSRFDFHRGRADGVQFVVGKVSESTHMADPTWPHVRQTAEALGMVVGGYHFYRPGADPRAQVEWYLRHAGPLAGLLWPLLDVELDPPERVGVDPHAYTEGVAAFCDAMLREAGHHCIIYSYADMWQWMGNPRSFGQIGHPLWKADYSHVHPVPLAGWSEILIHQYSDRGSVGGLVGCIDVDRCGSLDLLKAKVIG